MSDDAQRPGAPDHEEPDPWSPPDHSTAPGPVEGPRPQDAAPAPKVPLDKPVDQPAAETNPWAPPTDTGQSAPGAGAGAGAGARGGGVGSAPVPPDAGSSMPAGPQPWAGPFGPPGGPPAQPPAGGPYPNGSGNPFEPPGGPEPAAGVPGGPVPPPPISPDGPGQVPYGYGYPGYPAYGGAAGGGPGHGWPGMPMAPNNGLGTAGLVLGIIAAVGFCLWPVALACGILAVVFGVIGRGRARRGEATNPGHALAGIICGAVGIALAIAFVVVFLVVPDDTGSSGSETGTDGFNTSLVTES
ncbi:DUF4190 domain-containing protein [Streptomyces sp. NPDC050704]|uniref:DUF4190 domain-containing protein n=1 Tax=Streptomyces sp. NPDC050704 TaxID=3157219 RepID=UPI0034333814